MFSISGTLQEFLVHLLLGHRPAFFFRHCSSLCWGKRCGCPILVHTYALLHPKNPTSDDMDLSQHTKSRAMSATAFTPPSVEQLTSAKAEQDASE
jgi:hypothetical protein